MSHVIRRVVIIRSTVESPNGLGLHVLRGISLYDAAPGPVRTFVADDAVGPRSKSRRIIQAPQAPNDSQPRVLHDVTGGLAFTGQAPGKPAEPRLPPFDERLASVAIAVLTLQHQQLIQNVIVRLAHFSLQVESHERGGGSMVSQEKTRGAVVGLWVVS